MRNHTETEAYLVKFDRLGRFLLIAKLWASGKSVVLSGDNARAFIDDLNDAEESELAINEVCRSYLK